MICPIGVSMVSGKHPAEIAVSVAGELIAHYQGIPLEEKRPTSHSKEVQLSDSTLEEKIA
jgi:xanthine dehydrogenase accessory factor